MFLVEDRRAGVHNFVFTAADPRDDGYAGSVAEDVDLDYDMNAIHFWSRASGGPRPEPQLGQDPADPKHYKVFRFAAERESAGYRLVYPGTPIACYSWRDYRRSFPMPADLAEKLSEDEWFDYLGEVDDAAKQRRQKDAPPEPPAGSDLDRIAEWVAQQHLSADGSIRRILYLPAGAPPDELRLLEVNERVEAPAGRLAPLSFGTEVAGRPLTLSVVDVTGDQLEALTSDPSRLPAGWTFDGMRAFDGWRRRGLPA